jgi:hypothetical protein
MLKPCPKAIVGNEVADHESRGSSEPLASPGNTIPVGSAVPNLRR